ncbi:MAG: 3-dehydroquinate dehydratase [SAR202 cluster bacterium]|nr:3-dehydroquinate dehydratase [Chloroflexota bacterium]MBO20467.1 3-dehydroquinate dehydratase [Chloroflexota bacterium]MQG32847.1 3-dehydroquinate dehydratase [SAR202 cluster bacterium]HCL25391.1 3-dehydroquinate dehydratase [Dehalococcoidia bacterium]HCP24446.1 3-dehydroquinate dehydratase [Dehalococcoidia bacterium]|tara:strand:- start:477 stop:902 length:426 start_codon:yes stop_codon:yes gene_type:complete
MGKVLVIQGAGMNMRGKAQVEIFGPMTLDEMNEQIRGYAEGLGMDIELFQSNIEGEVVNALYDAHERNFDAALINPAGYTTVSGPLKGAITQVGFPVIEVHASNPTARGTVSQVLPVCKGSVYGFGVYGYKLALEAVKQMS